MAGGNVVSIELSVDERQNSLALHRSNLIKKYEHYEKQRKKLMHAGDCTKDILYYLGRSYDFTSSFDEVVRRRNYHNMMLRKTGINQQWTLGGESEDSDSESLREQYGINRVKLCKIMHLIDSIIIRISNNNIDQSILGDSTDVHASRLGLIWLFCESKDAREMDIQDMNRFCNLLMLQISRDVHEEESDGGTARSAQQVQKVYDELTGALFSGENEEARQREVRGYLNTFKRATKLLIREVFDVYDELLVYRDYLLSTNIINESADIIEDTEKILLLAETIKLIITERFTTYVKIGNMNLSHSELPGSWFNRSELSDSNFVNSVFSNAHFENAIFRRCDLSICDFTQSNAVSCDFTGSNFNYSNLSGMNLSEALLNGTQMSDTLFRDVRTDSKLVCSDYFENSPKKDNNIRRLCAKRLEQLEFLDANGSKFRNEDGRFVQNTLAEHFSFAKNGELFRLTTVSDSSNDISAHLITAPKRKGVYSTVMDEPAAFIEENVVKPYISYLEAQVISPELLAGLQQLEEYDSADDREDRLRRFGAVCLRPAIMRNAGVTDAIMPRTDLSHIDISDATFADTDISNSMMHYTMGRSAFFRAANISSANIFRSDFRSANFSNANAIGVSMVDCDLTGTSFSKALMLGSLIMNSSCSEPYLDSLLMPVRGRTSRLRHVSLLVDGINDTDMPAGKTSMIESDWRDALASNVNILGMNMDRSHFDGADMKSAVLFNCLARWSSFEKTDMSYALVMGVSFHQSAMQGIQLSKSRMFASEFSGCRLNGSTFIGSRCDRVMFYDVDLRESNFAHSIMYNCTFRDVNLKNVNFANAAFENVVFHSVDLTSCIGIDSASFKNCVFLEVKAADSAVSPSSGDNRGETFKLTGSTKLVCTMTEMQRGRRFTSPDKLEEPEG